MTTYRMWVFDSADDGPAVLDALRAAARSAGEPPVVALSWPPDQAEPRLDAVGTPSDLSGAAGLARRAELFDVIFLEPLRRAERGEAPDHDGAPAARFGLRPDDVSRLRDSVTPGRSAVVTTDGELTDAIADTLAARRPVAQYRIESEPSA